MLASPEIKIQIRGNAAIAADADDGEETAEAREKISAVLPELIGVPMTYSHLFQANQKLMGTLHKKHVVENVVPIVAGLKKVLEKLHSPLQRFLIEFLKVVRCLTFSDECALTCEGIDARLQERDPRDGAKR